MIKRYRITEGHCRHCPKRAECLPENAQQRARFVYRSPHQPEIDQVRKRQKTSAFIGKMILRKWTIEGLFAEAKQFHGLRRARYRGLSKVSIQALMTAMAQNIKRIINLSPCFYWQWKISLSVTILVKELVKLRKRLVTTGSIPQNSQHEFASR